MAESTNVYHQKDKQTRAGKHSDAFATIQCWRHYVSGSSVFSSVHVSRKFANIFMLMIFYESLVGISPNLQILHLGTNMNSLKF